MNWYPGRFLNCRRMSPPLCRILARLRHPHLAEVVPQLREFDNKPSGMSAIAFMLNSIRLTLGYEEVYRSSSVSAAVLRSIESAHIDTVFYVHALRRGLKDGFLRRDFSGFGRRRPQTAVNPRINCEENGRIPLNGLGFRTDGNSEG